MVIAMRLVTARPILSSFRPFSSLNLGFIRTAELEIRAILSITGVIENSTDFSMALFMI